MKLALPLLLLYFNFESNRDSGVDHILYDGSQLLCEQLEREEKLKWCCLRYATSIMFSFVKLSLSSGLRFSKSSSTSASHNGIVPQVFCWVWFLDQVLTVSKFRFRSSIGVDENLNFQKNYGQAGRVDTGQLPCLF